MGLVHLLSQATGRVACFDCFALFRDMLCGGLMMPPFWSALRGSGTFHCGLIALSS